MPRETLVSKPMQLSSNIYSIAKDFRLHRIYLVEYDRSPPTCSLHAVTWYLYLLHDCWHMRPVYIVTFRR